MSQSGAASCASPGEFPMGSFRHVTKTAIYCTAALALVLTAAPACARNAGEHTYHLPAQPLAESLQAVSTASGISIVARADVLEGRTAPVLDGNYTAEEAVTALLADSGLQIRRSGDGLIVERVQAEAPPAAAGESTGGEILVTGSRIRGAPVASPVVEIGQAQIRDAGYADLGQVARAIPQSFGGGQNPGIGTNVPAANGVDVGGGASLDLRGIGSDATLTLLNGHRLAYSSSRQSVDISAIPLAAVERIEIVADGASALYGSDAVAGVANIILRRR
jgi:outer membrane receptor protein involved in Fe transport